MLDDMETIFNSIVPDRLIGTVYRACTVYCVGVTYMYYANLLIRTAEYKSSKGKGKHKDKGKGKGKGKGTQESKSNSNSESEVVNRTVPRVKNRLIGTQVTIPIQNGKLVMGTWQGLWLCEFNNNNTQSRTIVATINGSLRN